jgi:hypothetical protein
VCLGPALFSLANGAVSNGRGLNLCGPVSNGRLHHDSVALANEHISIAHVIREAFDAQVPQSVTVTDLQGRWAVYIPLRVGGKIGAPEPPAIAEDRGLQAQGHLGRRVRFRSAIAASTKR